MGCHKERPSLWQWLAAFSPWAGQLLQEPGNLSIFKFQFSLWGGGNLLGCSYLFLSKTKHVDRAVGESEVIWEEAKEKTLEFYLSPQRHWYDKNKLFKLLVSYEAPWTARLWLLPRIIMFKHWDSQQESQGTLTVKSESFQPANVSRLKKGHKEVLGPTKRSWEEGGRGGSRVFYDAVFLIFIFLVHFAIHSDYIPHGELVCVHNTPQFFLHPLSLPSLSTLSLGLLSGFKGSDSLLLMPVALDTPMTLRQAEQRLFWPCDSWGNGSQEWEIWRMTHWI